MRALAAKDCDLFLSLHSNACNSASVDAPLACCTVTGTMDVLGQQLANVVHQVMGTAQAGTIWKRQGDNGDYYGVLAIGVNKDNTALLDAINQALAELTADGTVQSIVDKYISAE